MNWLFFAILAPFIFALSVDIDKYILEKEISDYKGMPIYSAIVAPIFGVLLWIFTGFPILSFQDTILIIFTGMLTIWGLASYFKALLSDEASKITILFQITPVMTLIMSYLFLKDGLTFNQLVGFALIFLATVGVSFNKKETGFNLSSTFFLILLTDFLWALAYVLFKFVVDGSSFSKVVSYESFGIGIGGLVLYLLFPSIKEAFLKTNKKIAKRVLVLVFMNEGLFVLARLFTYLAISLGPVALVTVVGGTQVFIAIMYGWVLTLIAPKIFKEDISKKGLTKKISMAMLVLIGLWFVQI